MHKPFTTREVLILMFLALVLILVLARLEPDFVISNPTPHSTSTTR